MKRCFACAGHSNHCSVGRRRNMPRRSLRNTGTRSKNVNALYELSERANRKWLMIYGATSSERAKTLPVAPVGLRPVRSGKQCAEFCSKPQAIRCPNVVTRTMNVTIGQAGVGLLHVWTLRVVCRGSRIDLGERTGQLSKHFADLLVTNHIRFGSTSRWISQC